MAYSEIRRHGESTALSHTITPIRALTLCLRGDVFALWLRRLYQHSRLNSVQITSLRDRPAGGSILPYDSFVNAVLREALLRRERVPRYDLLAFRLPITSSVFRSDECLSSRILGPEADISSPLLLEGYRLYARDRQCNGMIGG